MKNLLFILLLIGLFSSVIVSQQNSGDPLQGPLSLAENIERLEFNAHNQESTTVIADRKLRTHDGALHSIRGQSIAVIGANVEEKAKNYLRDIWPSLKHEQPIDDVLTHHRVQSFNGGDVVTMHQNYKGLKVLDGVLKIKFDHENRVRSIVNNSFPIPEIDIEPSVSAQQAISKAVAHLELDGSLSETTSDVELVIFNNNNEPRLAWRIINESDYFPGNWEVLIDAYDERLLKAKNRYYGAHGHGTVFNPSPTYSSMNEYSTTNFVNNGGNSNATLEAEMVLVDLQDIEEFVLPNQQSAFRLVGPNAALVDYVGDYDSDYDSDSDDFSCTRESNMFTAVMSYYFIDKSMRYVNDELGINARPDPAVYTGEVQTGGVQFMPNYWGQLDIASYDELTQQLRFGMPGSSVNPAEDAQIILHELAHGFNHWLSGDLTETQGLSEGIADYWGVSETRTCDIVDTYREWFYDEDAEAERYHTIFHWGSRPNIVQRTCNYNKDYNPSINYPIYEGCQYISTALVRILNDIGKEKTDRLLLEAMAMFTTSTNLQEAAEEIYSTAQNPNSNLSINEQCIIYQHFEDVFSISTNGVVAPSGGSGDLYTADSWCDKGEEINTTSTTICESEDIWVAHYYEQGWVDHFDPEYDPINPNWLYVRIRNRGCEQITDATLHVYFSKTSTGQRWPESWGGNGQPYVIDGPNGPVIAGDKIGSKAITATIPPGGEHIEVFQWYPPNPADFHTEIHDFCLLTRIVSSSDPMHIPEMIDKHIYANVKNNNNIAWKNVSVVDEEDNGPIPNTVYGPISVFVGSHIDYQGGSLKISTPNNSRQLEIFETGNVFIEMSPSFYTAWSNNGSQGTGYISVAEGKFKMISADFSFDNLPVVEEGEHVNIEYEPNDVNRYAVFDLIQKDSKGEHVGGQRFIYRPNEPQVPIGNRLGKIDLSNERFSVYPNPAQDRITIELVEPSAEAYNISIYNQSGKLILEVKDQIHQVVELNLESYRSGLYFIEIKSDNNTGVGLQKLIKL